MAGGNLDQTDMFAMLSSTSHFLCCRCSRTLHSAGEQLLPAPFCARHYVCRSCFLCSGGMQYCPGCVVVASTSSNMAAVVDSQRATISPASSASRARSLSRVNGAHEMFASVKTDANGNGPTTTTCDVCSLCGRRTDQYFSCQSCSDVDTSVRSLCHSCLQQHQLDVHVLQRLRLDVSSTSTADRSSAEFHSLYSSQLQDVSAITAGDEQRPRVVGTTTSNNSSVLRQIRPRLVMSVRDDHQSVLSGLMTHPCSTESSLVVSTTSSFHTAGALLAVGLHDPSMRHRRLIALQAPLSSQYEGWLWQALNNGGFEQAARNIAERKQQIGVNLQSTLRDMEFRLERARGVLDELYRELMRQVIEVSRCQMEALQVQCESVQRVRAAASRLQHARVYNDKARALAAESELASALRHNGASTCLRPCDDGWIEFRSPSDDELRAFLRSVCSVDSHVHAAHCNVQSVDREVNCLSWTLVGRLSEFDIHLRNHCHVGVDDAGLTVLISDSRGAELTYEYQRRSAGHFVVRYCPQLTGTHHIYVLLRDRHLADSPYTVGVTKPLCYRLSDSRSVWNLRPVVVLSYNLVKPWGVCCAGSSSDDTSHQFLIADRDAHSVLVFDRNGSFIARRTSSFRRPTHLAVTSRGHVVVTDKDNHRIQIFTSCWTHVRTFGSEGDRDGQFRYPWEVAVNSVDEILVSDSKNYRVQLFTSAGVFITKHCLERASRDDKDGPRGVAFAPNDFAAVADFDMLRVLLLSPDLRSVVHVVGVPGLLSAPRSPVELRTKGCIERPRGLAFDASGNLIVVQARTNRETNSLIKFTTTGECKELQFDKDACGMCVCNDGRIAVVQPQTGVVIYADL